MRERPALPVGLYRHRDGGLYDVVDLAHDSTSGPGEGRWMVLYRSHSTGRLNVRDVEQFTEPQTWPDGVTRPRLVPATRETTPAPGEPHSLPEAEVDRRGEAIIRRARAELLAIDPHCDCVVLWAARTLLALALDERVILPADAAAVLDLVQFLQEVQAQRRIVLGLDPTVVDGPAHPRAVAAGPLVRRVMVAIEGQEMPVAWALRRLKEEDADA